MQRSLILLAFVVLPGCAVTLHGNQTMGGESMATATGSSVQVGRQFGNARVGGSFGAPLPAHAAGGQVAFSRGASAVLVAGLVIAEAVDVIGGWFRPAAPRTERPTTENISQTCSCYGWQPQPMTSAPAMQ